MEQISTDLQVLRHRAIDLLLSAWEAVLSFLGLWNEEKEDDQQWRKERLEELVETIRLHEELRKKREQAHAAAMTGEGPQPWDADWYENDNDQEIYKQIYSLALKMGWHRLQRFREIMEIALLSPQMQEAARGWQASPDHDPGDPMRETFMLWATIYSPVRHASCEMLRVQAGGLGYTKEWEDDLEKALDLLLGNREQVAS